MFKTNEEKLIIDAGTGQLMATVVNAFATGLEVDTNKDWVILRLYDPEWTSHAGLVPRDQVHQFAIPAHRAGELGRQLLELEAQTEKEKGAQEH